MTLHALTITNAPSKEKPYKLADGGGLHLLVQPNGNKFWRFRYRFHGVEKMRGRCMNRGTAEHRSSTTNKP